MDLLGFKKRKVKKEADRLAKKKIEELKMKIIKKEYKALKEKADGIADEKNKEDREYVNRGNDRCPKCGSKKVNDRIKRIQGEFSGDASGNISGVGILGTGIISGSYHSKSHGEIDTNEVNKCECGHEWKKRKRDTTYDSKVMKEKFSTLRWNMDSYKKALKAKVNPKDLNEKYETDEEKRLALIIDAIDDYIKKSIISFFGDTSIESIMAIAELEIWPIRWEDTMLKYFKESFNEEFLEIIGLKHMELNV